MAAKCANGLYWKLKIKPNLSCHGNITFWFCFILIVQTLKALQPLAVVNNMTMTFHLWSSKVAFLSILCYLKYDENICINFLDITLIARFMGPAWVPPRAGSTQVGPCWPHELCYLGSFGSCFQSNPHPLLNMGVQGNIRSRAVPSSMTSSKWK